MRSHGKPEKASKNGYSASIQKHEIRSLASLGSMYYVAVLKSLHVSDIPGFGSA